MLGMSYAPIDADALADDKIFAFMRIAGGAEGGYDAERGMAAYGRLVCLLQRVYRDGFYLKVTKVARIRLLDVTGLDGKGLDDFLELCLECELFDRRMWEEHGVITSHGIQSRYFRARKRGTDGLDPEDYRYLLPPFSDKYAQDAPAARDGSATLRNEAREEVAKRRADEREDAATLRGLGGEEGAKLRAQDKEKEKEKRKEEEEEKESARSGARSSSSSSDSSEGNGACLPCMRSPSPDGALYRDARGGVHETVLGALGESYAAACPSGDFGRFCAAVGEICPDGCRGRPAQAERCGELIAGALSRFDPAKGTGPWPLVRKVLMEDRGEIDG